MRRADDHAAVGPEILLEQM